MTDLQELVRTTYGQGNPVPEFYVSVDDAKKLLVEIGRLQNRAAKEVAEFNAGYDHAVNGGRIDDEPTEGITEDHWRIGFQAGAYSRLLSENADLLFAMRVQIGAAIARTNDERDAVSRAHQKARAT